MLVGVVVVCNKVVVADGVGSSCDGVVVVGDESCSSW